MDDIHVMAPNERHRSFHDSLKAALGQHTDLSGPDILAIASQFVGSLIAAQDRMVYSPEAIMEVVAINIEIGNAMTIAANLGSPEGEG